MISLLSSRKSVIISLIALLATAQCSIEPHKSTFSPPSTRSFLDTLPVKDVPPYWCGLIPKMALVSVTGVDSGLSEYLDGWISDQGGCLVRDGSPAGPLGISWNRKDGRKTVLRQSEKYRDYRQVWLPEELGYGFAVYAPGYIYDRPYYVISAFRCGQFLPWLRIDVSRVREGRDPHKDLIALMRIAQKRFGVLRRCNPKAL